MALSEIERHQMVKLADGACHSRNNNVCVDLGKAEFAELDNGIEFYQTRFKLDSSQADHRYLVAKVVLCEGLWTILVAHRDHYEMFEGWHTHPEIKRLGNQLHQLIEEVEHDSQGLIW